MASLGSVTSWDLEADVVVVGAGLAGTVTAVAAKEADPGVEVLVLDTLNARDHGGASRCAAQYLNCPNPDEVEDLATYQRQLNLPYTIPEPVLQTWAHAVCNNRDWIAENAKAVGRELVYRFDKEPDFAQYEGSSAVRPIWSIGMEGEGGSWKTFRERCDQLEVPVVNDIQVYELVQDPDTLEVFGVLGHKDGEVLAIRARRGVALCLGGMGANADMLKQYAGYEQMNTLGCPANTGDGIKLLQKAGAEFWHLNTHAGGICVGMKVEGFFSAFIRDHLTTSSWIDIAKNDQRFHNEAAPYESTHFKELRYGHWRDIVLPQVLPAHMIFDDRTRRNQRLNYGFGGWSVVAEGYAWSEDNMTEVERGWIKRADTIEELAVLIGRDPASVRATVDAYNAGCESGEDAFGRDASRLEPIVEGPFYAIEITPAIPGTTGGGVRNEHAQVISQDGTPIPRLYEAGELGSTLCNLYQNGSLLTEAIAFGRIAGTALAAESPVESGAPTPSLAS